MASDNINTVLALSKCIFSAVPNSWKNTEEKKREGEKAKEMRRIPLFLFLMKFSQNDFHQTKTQTNLKNFRRTAEPPKVKIMIMIQFKCCQK